jgi:hypothetical protein
MYADPENKIDISPESLEILTSYHWPGNVRELQNVVQFALINNRGTQQGFLDKMHRRRTGDAESLGHGNTVFSIATLPFFTDSHGYLVFIAFITLVIRVHPCPQNGNSFTYNH